VNHCPTIVEYSAAGCDLRMLSAHNNLHLGAFYDFSWSVTSVTACVSPSRLTLWCQYAFSLHFEEFRHLIRQNSFRERCKTCSFQGVAVIVLFSSAVVRLFNKTGSKVWEWWCQSWTCYMVGEWARQTVADCVLLPFSRLLPAPVVFSQRTSYTAFQLPGVVILTLL
jgi:hypothetical protein